MATKTSRVTLKIEPELHDWFSDYAGRHNAGMSGIIREFLLLLKKVDDKEIGQRRMDTIESSRLHSS